MSEYMRVETVRVKRDGPRGYHTINKADFDPARHQLYDEPAAAALGAPVADPAMAEAIKAAEALGAPTLAALGAPAGAPTPVAASKGRK